MLPSIGIGSSCTFSGPLQCSGSVGGDSEDTLPPSGRPLRLSLLGLRNSGVVPSISASTRRSGPYGAGLSFVEVAQ